MRSRIFRGGGPGPSGCVRLDRGDYCGAVWQALCRPARLAQGASGREGQERAEKAGLGEAGLEPAWTAQAEDHLGRLVRRLAEEVPPGKRFQPRGGDGVRAVEQARQGA